MTSAPERRTLPFDRPDVLELAPLYRLLLRDEPIAAVTTPVGDPAWLVTGYDLVRDTLGDTRLGRSHPEPERASRISHAAVQAGPLGDFETERDDHSRMRALLTPSFSARRIALLTEHVRTLVDAAVDRMVAEHDSVVDLHAHLSIPVPASVICRLLGVPEADLERFGSLATRMSVFDPGGDAARAHAEFGEYMAGVAATKRSAPGEDVMSDLVAAQAADPRISEADMIGAAVGLLFAGHESIVSRIDLGVMFLLTRPGAWQALAADPEGQADATVEEILRMSASGDLGILRYAHADLDVGGVTVRRGDALILSINAANRDPSAYADPDAFDPLRAERAHLGFGHGPYFCIGASLARVQLRTVFVTLARRLPGLRMAADLDALGHRSDHINGSIETLPVTWR